MKISQIQNQIFKGHGAGRIKALYMQNPNIPSQIPIYRELRTIGQKHGFDVFIHGDDELFCQDLKYPTPKHCDYELWAQDNKTILKRDGKTTVISGLYIPETEKVAAKNLAKVKNAEYQEHEIFMQGGNFFVGKKTDGKNYLIIGMDDFYYSAIHYFLKSKIDDVTVDKVDLFGQGQDLKNDEGEIIASFSEFDDEFEKWGEIAALKFREIFDLEKGDTTLLAQGQYHNDLVVRPLNYPYVLVGDENLALENLEKLKKEFKFSPKTVLFVNDMKRKIEKQKQDYISSDVICDDLEKNGFIPIRVGGSYGLYTINFINAIVHQNGDDLIYITNSCIGAGKDYEYLQMLFEKELKEKCPQITKVYFVKGAITDKKSNIILEYLKRHKGGIHCLCAEEM